MATPLAKKPTLAAILLRITCPIVVYGWLLWVAIASSNIKLLGSLIGLALTIVLCVYLIRPITRCCSQADLTTQGRAERLKIALLMTKRMGGIFCIIAVVTGISYFYLPRQFLHITLPVLLSGWAAMIFSARAASHKIVALTVK